MLGGSSASFLAEYWRRKPLHAPAAAPEFAGSYGIEEFFEDTVATKPSPYNAVGIHNGRRDFSQHSTVDGLRASVAGGRVASIKLSKLWHRPDAPARWAPFRALFGSLCRAVSMLYMNSARSEDVDLFFAGPRTQLGTHFDITDGFTVQLVGERVWTVDQEPQIGDVLGRARDPDWHPANEVPFSGRTREVTLQAGDALYVPAYSVHRVTSTGWSLSLGLGVRSFNEIDFVEHLLEMIRNTRYAEYPRSRVSRSERRVARGREARARAARPLVLEEIEIATVGATLAPLDLPPTLGGE